jgi:preprotein translocase subunit YajC
MSTTLLFPLLLILLVGFMFFGTRKQKRAAAQQQDMQKSLSFGDRVMTTSGLYATVVSTSDDTLDLEISDGVVTTWLRAAVREKVADDVTTESVDEDAVDSEEEYYADDAEVETVQAPAAETEEHQVNGVNAHVNGTAAEPESNAEIAPPLEQSKKSR